jgi:hypothetical protein
VQFARATGQALVEDYKFRHKFTVKRLWSRRGSSQTEIFESGKLFSRDHCERIFLKFG